MLSHACFQILSHRRVRFLQTKIASNLRMIATESAVNDPVHVVSCCSRGIGLEFTRQLLETRPGIVIGLCRTGSTEGNANLSALQDQHHSRLFIKQVDLADQSSITSVSKLIRNDFGRVDTLLNVAGILGDAKTTPGPERSIQGIERQWLQQSMEINLIGHVMLTQALFPLLKRSKEEKESIVINLSARVGSISDNRLGGWYSYRMSKAALNMFTKTFSLEAKRFRCIVLSMHPGTTDTDLSKPFQGNVAKDKLFSVEYSVDQMLSVIDQSTLLTHSGRFYAYDGSEIPF